MAEEFEGKNNFDSRWFGGVIGTPCRISRVNSIFDIQTLPKWGLPEVYGVSVLICGKLEFKSKRSDLCDRESFPVFYLQG